MKKIFIILFFCCAPLLLLSQNDAEIQEIKNSGNYLSGTGFGESYQIADHNALDNLITQITVQVESEFVGTTTEKEGDVTEFAQSIVKTYSNVSLVSARSVLISEKKGNYQVMRYISIADLKQVFENRKIKIWEYVKAGQNAERDMRLGDALKNYYWALALLQSHQDRDKITYDFDESGESMLMTALPEIINNVFTDLSFSVQNTEWLPDEKYKAFYLKVSYNDQPVDNLDFIYWTGRNYSNPVNVRSGIGLVEFYDIAADQPGDIKLMVEYDYKHKANYDLEVDAVFSNMQLPYLERCEFIIPLKKQIYETEPELIAFETKKVDFAEINKVERSRKLRKQILKIVDAISVHNYETVQSDFTFDGWVAFQQLITNGNVKVLPFVDTLRVIQMDSSFIVRSVPMRFSFENNTRDFIEQVVFTFNYEHKIDAVSFAISDKAIADIVSRSHRFGTVEDKYHLINFMEHYKTAYCLKRLDYIESIFAENALIIVGNMVKREEPIDGMYQLAGKDQVKYIELSKTEYIERLRSVFNSNEFVNIHFEENIINKVNGESKLYGIQIKQDYYSTTYADQGYLFLMIDLNDSLKPKIYVRTWQPERSPDGGIYGLNDFFVN